MAPFYWPMKYVWTLKVVFLSVTTWYVCSFEILCTVILLNLVDYSVRWHTVLANYCWFYWEMENVYLWKNSSVLVCQADVTDCNFMSWETRCILYVAQGRRWWCTTMMPLSIEFIFIPAETTTGRRCCFVQARRYVRLLAVRFDLHWHWQPS